MLESKKTVWSLHMTRNDVLRKIGSTGVSVFPIGLGGLPLSTKGRPAELDGIRVIHAAIDAGVDFIDTANVYCIDDHDIGQNERLIAKALKQKPQSQVSVATKGGYTRPNGSWIADGKPKSLRKACEKSLKDLGVEWIFLYQLHAPDPSVPIADSIGELKKLQDEGKVRHLGVSNFSPQQIDLAQSITRIESVQNRLNPMCQRDLYNGVMDVCHRFGMSYIAYSPVGGGLGHEALANHPTLVALAQKHCATPHQIMVAFALAVDPCVIPIPGASKVGSITSSVAAQKVVLSAADIQNIKGIEAPTLS